MNNEMKELIGHVIEQVYISDDKKILVFFTPYDSFFAYEAMGDCCSYSWFESITNIDDLIGEQVLSSGNKCFHKDKDDWNEPNHSCDDRVELETDDDMDYDEGTKLDIYGHTLTTRKGYIDIEYRNESNGYYGGWFVFQKGAIIAGSSEDIKKAITNKLALSITCFMDQYSSEYYHSVDEHTQIIHPYK